jgi:hypothetical protein
MQQPTLFDLVPVGEDGFECRMKLGGREPRGSSSST